jgi:hypothetical protein
VRTPGADWRSASPWDSILRVLHVQMPFASIFVAGLPDGGQTVSGQTTYRVTVEPLDTGVRAPGLV